VTRSAALVGLLTLSGLGFRSASAVAGDRPATFSAVTTAEGVRGRFDAPNFLVVPTLADAAGPIAQSVFESSGVSKSFASLPYPGDTVIAGPGLLAAAGGPSLPVGYPFFVSAAHPATPDGRLEDPGGRGGYRLAVTARERSTDAVAETAVGPEGASAQRAVATTRIEQSGDGRVTSRASSVVEGVAVGGALTIGSIRATASAVLEPGGATPTFSRTLDVTGAAVGGVAVNITPTGVVAGPQAIPAPLDQVTASANQALAQAGVTVALVSGVALPGGGTSDAVRITSRRALPAPANSEGILTLTLGGTSAVVITGVTDGPELDLPAVAPGSGDTGAGAGGPGAADPATSGVSPTPSGRGITAAPAGSSPVGAGRVPTDGSAGGATAAAPDQAAAPATGTDRLTGTRHRRSRPGHSADSLYAVLVGAAAVLLAGSNYWRTRGVVSPWIS
jgi:hypothetical protein